MKTFDFQFLASYTSVFYVKIQTFQASSGPFHYANPYKGVKNGKL